MGVNLTGTSAIGNADGGVLIDGARDNTIGGPNSGAGNVISGNGVAGIRLSHAASGNMLQRNYVGTDATGSFSISNPVGVLVDEGAHHNHMGTDQTAGNLVSGNTMVGVQISGSSTQFNEVRGNIIGLDKKGDKALANGLGIRLDGGATSHVIGGDDPAQGNVISGNLGDGIWVTGIICKTFLLLTTSLVSMQREALIAATVGVASASMAA